MKFIISILSSSAFTIFFVRGVIAFLKRPGKAETGKVYLPNFFLILGLIISVAFIIPTVITFAFVQDCIDGKIHSDQRPLPDCRWAAPLGKAGRSSRFYR